MTHQETPFFMSDATSNTHLQRLRKLADDRQRVIGLPTEKMVAAILSHPHPAALVHSFSEIDLHLLIRDIGPEDALPLVRLASNRQWEYVLDAEVWRRDQVDCLAATLWLGLLLEADPGRLVNWCFEDQLEFLELYLFRNIEVRIREFDQMPSDLGEGFVTDDDTFYIRFVTDPVHMPADAAQKYQRDAMLAQLLHRISAADHVRYQGLLMEAAAVIPAEMEEELFRLRNVRLAEKGLLPFHEAIGVFQPLRPVDLKHRGKKYLPPPPADLVLLPVPMLAASFLASDTRFVRALKSITDIHVLGRLQTELASLCNQMIVAGEQQIQDRRQLADGVEMASHYLGIGIERMLDTAALSSDADVDAAAARLLRHHVLMDLFRVGYGAVLDLRSRALRWQQNSRFRALGLDLWFWDEAWMGVLGGLFIDRPKYYDPVLSGTLYRDFHTMAEIEGAGKILDQIVQVDQLLPQLSFPDRATWDTGFFTYKSLLLTVWARHRLKMKPGDDLSIPLSAFRPFYQGLWTEKEGKRIIDADRRADFLGWVAGVRDTRPDGENTAGSWDAVVNALFDEIESELADVRHGSLDPRHIRLFMLKFD